VRIATWNVNSLKARQDRVEEWLAYARPDVLCLQETKLADKNFPQLDSIKSATVIFPEGPPPAPAPAAKKAAPSATKTGAPATKSPAPATKSDPAAKKQ